MQKNGSNAEHGAIERLPGPSEGRSAGSMYGDLAWTAAVSNSRVQDIVIQSKDAFMKIENQLKEIGSDRSGIISATVWLADMAQKPIFDKLWIEWIGPERQAWPQRVCVGATLGGGCLVEIFALGLRRRN